VSPSPHPRDDKRAAFLAELLRGASASLAAARTGLNRGTVYRWKREDTEFAAVWAEILAVRPRHRDLRGRVLAFVMRDRRWAGYLARDTGRRRETTHPVSNALPVRISPEAHDTGVFRPCPTEHSDVRRCPTDSPPP